MKAYLSLVAMGFVLAAASVRADDEAELQGAKQDLQSAHAHLKAAKGDYDGHRNNALDLVGRAVNQVEQGLAVAKRKDVRDEKKVQQLEKKQQNLDKKIENLKQ